MAPTSRDPRRGPWHTRRMPPAKLAAVLALLGGTLWIVRALLGGGDDPVPSTLHLIGLACLLVGRLSGPAQRFVCHVPV